MPIYETELPHGEMQKVVDKGCVCLECGGLLLIAWGGFYGHNEYMLRCGNDPKHNGIARDASLSPYDIPGFNLFNLNKGRRKMVEEQVGKEVSTKLAKYMGVVSLTKPEAKEILLAVFPEAPEAEITRAMILCANYGLNPLMKHVFLIPFNKGKQNESWATVLGIKAKRLLASRRGPYSYVEYLGVITPRVLTEQEQVPIFGKSDPEKLWVITKGRDPATGAEAVGYGFWPKNKEPFGTDKGNTAFNMAAIRSESQMVDRLRPGEMPEGIDVVPEEMVEGSIEGEFKVLKDEPSPEAEPEAKEHWCTVHDCAFEKRTGRGGTIFYSHKLGDGWCNEKKPKAAQALASDMKDAIDEATESSQAPPEPVEGLDIDMEWLNESLKKVKWDEKTAATWLTSHFGVEGGLLKDVLARLSKEQQGEFVKEIQDRLQMA